MLTTCDHSVQRMSHDDAPSIEEFHQQMLETRDLRRQIVCQLLNGGKYDESLGDKLKSLASSIQSNSVGEKKFLRVGSSSVLEKAVVPLDVHDEFRGLDADLAFFDCLAGGKLDIRRFINLLADVYHVDREQFEAEVDRLEAFLSKIPSNPVKFAFITDWDGTFKTYGNSYATCVQPCYSGLILALFSQLTRFSAVLTAGPLENFGIFDLTCIPKGQFVTFGGSSGNEWWIDGQRVVNEGVFGSDSEKNVLAQLGDAIEDLLSESRFRPFFRLGSGFQRKVDRITLGVQTVSKDVPVDLSNHYCDAVKEVVSVVDPDGKTITVHRTDLELELIVSSKCVNRPFNKSDGVALLLNHMSMDLSDGKILVCGDTLSDLPLVASAKRMNPDGTYAVFVDPTAEVQTQLEEMLAADHLCIVSSPPVLQCGMMKAVMLIRKSFP